MGFSMELVKARRRIKELDAKVIGLEAEVSGFKVKIAELEETVLEYHEIIETGWDYPNVTLELPSPRGLIPKQNVKYSRAEKKLTILDCPETIFPVIANTNSMEPWLDVQHLAFLIPMPQTEAPLRYEDLKVGDVAVYQAPNQLIFHTIVKITQDDQGRVYTFRGNNTAREDPYLVRDSNIVYLYYGGVNVI